MAVFIVYCADGYDGQQVDVVLRSREAARRYVIDHVFGDNQAYADRSHEELDRLADGHIDEFDVIDY